MKKNYFIIIILILLSSFIIYSCSETFEEEYSSYGTDLDVFLKSKTFLNHQSIIEKWGEISYDKIIYEELNTGNEDENAGYFVIPLLKNAVTVGFLEVVDLKATDCLPNGDRYAINYVNLEDFNPTTLSGMITMIDLNYENYLHSIINVENNKIITWENDGLSESLRLKYCNNTASNTLRKMRAGVSCDPNRDGNISFAECYNCMKAATQPDSGGPLMSQWICDFPFFGQLSCWTSISAACVYISSAY